MKKVLFMLGAILVLAGCTKPTEELTTPNTENQLTAAAMPTDNWTEVMDPLVFNHSIPLMCGEESKGVLTGNLEVFCRMHWENGEIAWMIHEYTGTLVGPNGEVFVVKDIHKYDGFMEKTFRSNVRGDQGSHYILLGTFTYDPFALTIDKAVCPGNAGE